MQFSVTTGEKNGIIQACELLLDVGDGGISGDSTLLKQFTLLANKSYDNIIAQILENAGDYVWDDSNYTDFPIATLNLVDGQQDYPLPVATTGSDVSTFLRLIGVQVLDTSARYRKVYKLTRDDYETPLETQFYDKGFPKGYRELDSSIFLYPPVDQTQVTLTAGLQMLFQRDKIDFLSTDTTKQPGFPSIYHYLLPLEMSEAWAAIKKLGQLQFIQQKKAEFIHNLGWGMSNRNKDQRQRLTSISARRDNRYE